MWSLRTIACLGKREPRFVVTVFIAPASSLTILCVVSIAFITRFPTEGSRKASSVVAFSGLTSICISAPIHLWSRRFCSRLLLRRLLRRCDDDENETQRPPPAEFNCVPVRPHRKR